MTAYLRLNVCGMIIALLLYSITLPALAQKPMKLKFTSPLAPPPFLISETAKWWADEVAKRSGGRIEWEFFWMGALTKAGEELEAVEIGLAQVGTVAAPYYAGKLPLNNWSSAWCSPTGSIMPIMAPRHSRTKASLKICGLCSTYNRSR